jgi:hypothetical protein
MYHKRLNWRAFLPKEKKLTKNLSWVCFFAQGEKRANLLHTIMQ